MSNVGQMMKKLQDMQARMTEMHEKLAATELTGVAGGGMVQIVMTGKGETRRITIDPSLVNAEKDVLEDLIVAAINDARAKVDAEAQEQMGKLTGGLPLPPGFKMPF